MLYPKDTDSKRIEKVCVYQPKFSAGTRRRNLRMYTVVFVLFYIAQLTWVGSTIGEPYRKFLEKADREGFHVMEGATKLRAELEHTFADINNPNRRTKKIGWTDWMDMDIDELVAEKKRDQEKTVLDSLPKSMRVPNRYSPAFFPTLLLGILVTLHCLVLLMQYWSVGFNVWINYKEMKAEGVELPEALMELDLEEDELRVAAMKKDPKRMANKNEVFLNRAITNPPSNWPTHARVVPAKGRDVMVPLEYFPTLGMVFEYHRRRYYYDADTATWLKVRCRTDIPLSFLESWTGFHSDHHLISGQIRYGSNTFSVRQPTFSELYKAQLLSPFTVFQLFCVILWMLDSYWQYSAFTLFMVLTFEATVVFSRIKSLQALRGMGNMSRPVWVHRLDNWTLVETAELLPGDIMSLTRIKPHFAKVEENKNISAATAKKGAKRMPTKVEDEGGDVIPADLLLLRGSTVVNEASLTGESVPQMKEGLLDLEEGETLSMKSKHKMSVAYAGTKMLQCKGSAELELEKEATTAAGGPIAKPTLYRGISNPPDNGCVCFVLRTGFSSAQGKLVRMIEGSQEKVKGHEKETGLLLLLLFVFAMASSSYVLYHGLRDESRSQYELLLHCILIVTNVIPPELPMQMALAVNNSLMTLMKLHIFCTEPFRVPIAGKLDAALFDKTGTLTTDELVAVGICEPIKLETPKGKEEEDDKFLTPMSQIGNEAALVLAGCHSLVYIEEETTGDPLECASLKAMRWQLSKSSGHAVPKPATEKRPAGRVISLKATGEKVSEIEILTRHHFSSKLQRMSCVMKATSSKSHFAVVKGSPEAIGKLLAYKPEGYDAKASYLSKEGYRVIGLAYKPLTSSGDVESAMENRSKCEADLMFAGFIAFTCRVRKDTAAVLQRLKEGGLSIAMVTGDALLTAVHVAKEVNICDQIGNPEEETLELEETNEELRALLESKRKKGKKEVADNKKKKKEFKPILLLEECTKNGSLFWESYETGDKVNDFVATHIPALSKDYDLATTGKSLAAAFEFDEETKKVLGFFKVFARMTPDAKETVIECLHSVGSLCLMCGDGANDVGALKQADVGVALLTGFGDINVEKAEEPEKEKKKGPEVPVTAVISQEHLDQIRALPVGLLKMKIRSIGADPDKYPDLVEKEDLVQLYQIKAREVAIKRHEKKNQVDKAKMTKEEKKAQAQVELAEKQRRLAERTAELEAQGVSWAQFKAMKEIMNEEVAAAKRKKGGMGNSVEAQAGSLASQLEDMDGGGLPMIKLGDASVAAPFTSKMPSIRSCVDIVRQGRCTLVSSIQMYQIMALQCLISSYSLSVLYLDGVKYGDTQMTAMGMLGSVSFMSVSRSRPLDRLSKVRPLTSIFHPALFISLLGQFTIHLSTMVIAVYYAKQHLPPDHKVELEGQFQPGVLNTVVFLVSNVQQVTVFVANLQGRPFMTGLTENRPLLWSLVCTFILTFMFASETVPGLNKYFQLVPLPDEVFRNFILKLLLLDVSAAFLFDRLMKFIFCREIIFASMKGTTWKDVFALLRTVCVIAFLMYNFLGNDEGWEELMRMEAEMMEDLVNGTEDATNGTDLIGATAECVGEACKAIVNESIGDGALDEF